MKQKALIRDYWPRYKRQSLLLVVGMQILVALVIASALLVTGIAKPNDPLFWIMLLSIVFGGIGVNLLMFSIISEPLQMLANALTHATGEPTASTPPNPNAHRFEKNGLRPLLQAIYEFGSQAEPAATEEKQVDEATSNVTQALEQTNTGVVFMSNGQIAYANAAAPVQVNSDGSKSLELIFETDITIEDWLADCEKKAVKAEHTWRRIANRIVGEENRKIYDIVGSYQKGSAVDTVLTFIDQTEIYTPEEQDLDFISFAAHELRSPITVIRGYLDTLNYELSDRISPQEQELFDRLTVSSDQLANYVKNILNAAKYDRRHLQMHLYEESMEAIYASIKEQVELRATTQNRLVTVSLPSTLPTVAADKSSIGEVLVNLIDNALKYSYEGGTVVVTADVVGPTVEVTVTDQGIGMPSNVMNNLFHKFYRSHRSRETVSGSGIGLYICKAIVGSHGGTISVRSVEGQGSSFTFSLPIYSTVAEKLRATGDSNESLIKRHGSGGWIKNHGAVRG